MPVIYQTDLSAQKRFYYVINDGECSYHLDSFPLPAMKKEHERGTKKSWDLSPNMFYNTGQLHYKYNGLHCKNSNSRLCY